MTQKLWEITRNVVAWTYALYMLIALYGHFGPFLPD